MFVFTHILCHYYLRSIMRVGATDKLKGIAIYAKCRKLALLFCILDLTSKYVYLARV